MDLAVKVHEPCWKCTQSPRTEAQGNPVADKNHQLLIQSSDQANLTDQPRCDQSPWDDVEGIFGISTLGTSFHGPRVLLEVNESARKIEAKVMQSTETH